MTSASLPNPNNLARWILALLCLFIVLCLFSSCTVSKTLKKSHASSDSLAVIHAALTTTTVEQTTVTRQLDTTIVIKADSAILNVPELFDNDTITEQENGITLTVIKSKAGIKVKAKTTLLVVPVKINETSSNTKSVTTQAVTTKTNDVKHEQSNESSTKERSWWNWMYLLFIAVIAFLLWLIFKKENKK